MLGLKQHKASRLIGDMLAPDFSLKTNAHSQAKPSINYYPFGSSMVSYKNEEFSFAYAFNGMERDDETGLTNFGARLYSEDYGRWLSLDPLANSFAYESNYVYVGNNPIIYIDVEGKSKYLTIIEVNKQTEETTEIRVLIDNEVLERVYDNKLGVENYAYYDINEVHKTVIDKDGNKTTEIYTERGDYRAKTLLPSQMYANWVKTETEEEIMMDKGFYGIRWTTSRGGSFVGQGNSKQSSRRYERSENIDLLLGVLKQTKITSTKGSGPVTILNVLKMLKSIWETGGNVSKGIKDVEEAQKKEQQYDSNGHGCNTCSDPRHGTFDYHDRSGNEINGVTGDTLNKKNNEKID